MITLKIDEEVQGNKKEFHSVEELSKELNGLLDERVYEVTIKKRAAVNSAQEGCSNKNLQE